MHNAESKWKSWLQPPQFLDDEQQRIGQILHIICWSCMAVIIIPILHNWHVGRLNSVQILLAEEFALGVALVFMHRKYLCGAISIVAMSLLATGIGLISFTGNGIRDVAMLMFPTLLVIAALILNRRLFILYSILTVLSVSGMIWAEIQGLIPSEMRKWTSLRTMVDIAIILMMTALIVGLLAEDLKTSLLKALRKEKELAASNQELARQSECLQKSEENLKKSILERDRAEEGRANLEAQLRQSQKMQAFGQLAGGVAHDFNNILTIIQSHAELLREGSGSELEQKESINEIAMAAERAANLTRQLLTFSRRQVLQPVQLNLNEVVANMVKMLQRLIGEHIGLEVHYAMPEATVYADPGMLEQVLMNLAVNSRDAMPRGGALTIKTEVIWLNPETFGSPVNRAAGNYVHLSIRDSGEGIASENLPRIFEPFFTTKAAGKGTGLGLAMVYGIVEQHQGWIEVESKLDQGTTFHVFLPHCTQPVTSEENLQNEKIRGGTETILVVEDEPAVRLLACNILKRKGYRVIEAGNGQDAMMIWQQQQDSIDLLLTDLIMPGGLSGIDLAERLLKERPSLKVVYCSGYGEEVLGKDSLAIKSGHFIQKPYDPQRLAQMVRQCLDKPIAK